MTFSYLWSTTTNKVISIDIQHLQLALTWKYFFFLVVGEKLFWLLLIICQVLYTYIPINIIHIYAGATFNFYFLAIHLYVYIYFLYKKVGKLCQWRVLWRK